MTRNEIIAMAKEASQFDGTTRPEKSIVLYAAKSAKFLEKFANLVAEKEREAIIDIVAFHGGSVEIEAAIRARGEA